MQFRILCAAGVSLGAMLAAGAGVAQAPADPSPAQAATSATAPLPGGQAPGVNAQATDATGEIVVTGTRLAATGFTTPTPVTVFGGEQLVQRAPAAVAESLYELPTFFNNGTTANNRGSSSVGFNSLDLRGIGAVRTLVLVDGRRYTPSNTTTVFDTNLIPTALVSRTEIVTGGASAAYGSDAVSGVVNFILRDKIEGIDGTAQYGISQRGDNREVNINIAGGHSFGDKFRVIFGGDYSRNYGVGYPGEGFYARDWGRNEYGRLSLTAARAAGLPANILGSNIEFANKTPGSIIVSGPLRGTAFNAAGQPYAFQYGSLVGTDQMQGSTANFGYSSTGKQPLRTALERLVGLARATWDVGPDTSIFLEGNYGKQEGRSNTAQAQLDNIIIQRNNPYIPLATQAAMDLNKLTTITIGRLNEEPGPYMTHNTNELIQGTLGAKGTIGKLSWDGYVEAGRNKYHLDVRNVMDVPNIRAALGAVRDTTTNQIVCGPIATNPNLSPAQRLLVESGCVPFNPFGQGSPSAAAIDYTTNYMFNDVTAKQQVAALNFRISPFDLPAGPISLAFGGEYRHNSALGTADARSAVSANFYGNYKPIDGKVSVKEGYLEVGVPLLKDMAIAHALDLNGAVRVTDYSTSGTVTTWKAGVTYEPIEAIRLRVTRSRDIRAPNIGELFAQGTGGVFTGNNPLTGTSGLAQTTTRGNPNLVPEVARTWTGGIVLTPQSIIPGLRLSADYFDIQIAGVIASPGGNEILSRCLVNKEQAFCDRLVFDTTSVLGVSNIYLDPANLNKFKARGVDFELSYRVPTSAIGVPGALNLRALGTYTKQLETFATSGSLGNQAGGGIAVAGISGIPKWRWTITAAYTLRDFYLNLQVRTLSKTRYGNGVNFIGPEDAGYSATLPNSISTNRYPAVAYLNLSTGVDVVSDGRRRFQLFFNIDNVLDKSPPVNWISDVATYDTVGRSFKVGARFSY